ncbi:phosphate ABC transporter permease PstA [Clostridium grantii]|uniref:Phosphate transport system permease protein PstA n=1 Tax=Clostridium grantii DSM 8605 TaxID=1121316 RepID=A0A1M5XGC8_9CLOT|nr:phosphate ABC transporter permease PstA [Clostridium grantii]SHH98861.1 phosphate ABC transporter membrane protein 2, PhoT family [Clostridium grantii DSM 8605]
MKNKGKLLDKIFLFLIYFSAFITIGVLIWILTYVIMNGIKEINWNYLTAEAKGDNPGIFPMIVSTLYIVILSIIIATPIGIGAAIYLVEYAKPGKLVRLIRFATESLSGIPSIIFGLFGMLFFVTALKLKFSLLSGALTLSIMVLPTLVRTTEEALKSVPDIYREGSYGLGASKLRTITNIILPSAIPGILAAVILSIGRIVGETAAVYFTAGMVPRIPSSIMNSGRTLAVHLYVLAKEGISFQQAFATATILIFLVAIINFLANRIAKALKRA